MVDNPASPHWRQYQVLGTVFVIAGVALGLSAADSVVSASQGLAGPYWLVSVSASLLVAGVLAFAGAVWVRRGLRGAPRSEVPA